jgi:ABC-type uncharacterized transport system substrate-binding protein
MELKKIKLILLFSFVAVLVFTGDSTAQTAEKQMKKVLVVHSYNQEYEWVSTISRGIKRVFEPEKDITVETFFMDTQNTQSEEKRISAGLRAREIISQWDPDLVITVDDNAQEYCGKYYAGKKRPLIVFCGVSRPIETYGYPAENITGIQEISTLKKAVDFLDQRITHVKNISIISDASPLSEYLISITRDEMTALGKKVVSAEIAGTFNKWKSAVSACQKNSSEAIYLVFYNDVKGGDGTNPTPKEVIKWTAANSRIPVFGLSPDIVDNGALFCVTGSGLEQGQEAAMIALALMKGQKILNYPVKTGKRGMVLFNKKTAERLGIEITDDLIKHIDVIVGE